MTSPEILDIVPEHVADPVRPAPWPARLGTAVGDGLLSAALNAAVVVWLVGIGWPRPPAPAPAAISVDLVDHMPGDKAAGGGKPGDAGAATVAKSGPAEGAKPEAAAGREHAGDPPTEKAAARAEAVAAPAPAPAKLPPAPTTEPGPAAAPEPATASAATPSAAAAEPAPERPAPITPAPQAVPAAPEHPDTTAQPKLVEAPQAPHVAATQAENHERPVVAPPAPAAAARPGPPPAQPTIITAPSDEVVAAPAAPPPKTPAEVAEAKRQAAATAALAAVLPFGANVSGDPFQATVSAQGQALNDSYRGAVYGNFSTRAADVQAEAQARGLKGTAVVAFSVDGDGNLASSGIALSSGQPEVDRMALEMIRRAAPYPPPPPGAQRSFSTALSFGSGD